MLHLKKPGNTTCVIALLSLVIGCTGFPNIAAAQRSTPEPSAPQSRKRRINAPSQTPETVQQPAPRAALPLPPPPPPPKPTPTPAPVAPEAVDDDEVINVVSKLVVVPVSVTDAKGEPVRGLVAADFRIDERGREQQVAELGDPGETPLDIALLVDVSGSVRTRFEFEREAAARFLRQVMKPADRASVFFIDAAPRLISRRNTAEEAARLMLDARLSADQTTAFYDTVVESARFLRAETPARRRRVVIALTDGFDTNSELTRSIAATTREVQQAEAVFYAINPSGNSLWLNEPNKRSQAEMVALAEATGGTAFVPNVLEDLDLVFRRIAAELRSQYLLQYYSNNEAAPGTYLPIKVATPKRPELRVRARQGYFSGAPAASASTSN